MELNLQSSNDQVIMPGVKRFFFFKNVFNLIFLMNWNCGLKKIQAPQPNSEPSFKDT